MLLKFFKDKLLGFIIPVTQLKGGKLHICGGKTDLR